MPGYGAFRSLSHVSPVRRLMRRMFIRHSEGRMGKPGDAFKILIYRYGHPPRQPLECICRSRTPRRQDPCRTECEQSGASGARSGIRNPICRSGVSGTRNAGLPGTTNIISFWSSYWACNRPLRPRAESVAFLFGKAAVHFKPSHINTHFAYGARRASAGAITPSCLRFSVARSQRWFFQAAPVRLAHDRYQQLQAGIKRHPFKMRSKGSGVRSRNWLDLALLPPIMS